MDLMSLPTNLEIGDIAHSFDGSDHSLGLIDEFRFDSVEKSSEHRPRRPP